MDYSEFPYEIPQGLHAIPKDRLDLRPDADIDKDLTQHQDVTDEKNIWFYWHNGYESMYPTAQRTVRSYYRRFSKLGWKIRVVNRDPGSALNIDRLLDPADPALFPVAFREEAIVGDYPAQICSDLVRFPLLLNFGGIYADVGVMPIGDLDQLWNKTVGNEDSPYEVFTFGEAKGQVVTNYFMAARRDNALFQRCHKFFIKLWSENGGRTGTQDMHSSPLFEGLPLFGEDNPTLSWTENGRTFTMDEGRRMLTDYLCQGQTLNMVLGTIDAEDDWNGPQYGKNHVFAINFLTGSQLINDLTAWDGSRQFELLSLPLPVDGEAETSDQKKARHVVEQCLQRSFAFKLATGLIVRVMGDTLASLWKKNPKSDTVPGTYAHWLRHATTYFNQDSLPEPVEIFLAEPVKRGRLLGPN